MRDSIGRSTSPGRSVRVLRGSAWVFIRSLSFWPVPLLLSAGCFYDYSGLERRPGDAAIGIPGTGGAEVAGTGGDPGAVPDGGPSSRGTGGTVGEAGGAAGGTGGGDAGSGGRKNGTGGNDTGGSTGGASGGSGAGKGGADASTGGAGATGGLGGGAGARGDLSRILSIDFIGGTTTDRLAGPGGNGAGGISGAGGSVGTSAPLVSLPRLSATESAGVKPATHWNGAPGGAGVLTALALSDGTITAALVTWNSPASATQRAVWSIGYADAPGDVRMMNGYLDPHGADSPDAPATIVVSGLPAAITMGGYDVYVYASGQVEKVGWSRTSRYAIGTSAITISQPGPSPTTFSGYLPASPDGMGNYVVFRNLTTATFTLTATPGPSTAAAGDRAPVNGIQIVSPSGS